MILDVPYTGEAVTRRQAYQVTKNVLSPDEHQYIHPQVKDAVISRGEMYPILQTSLARALRNRLQSTGVYLDLGHNKQLALETLMEEVLDDLAYSVMGVKKGLVKYLERSKPSDELSGTRNSTEIDFIGPLPN